MILINIIRMKIWYPLASYNANLHQIDISRGLCSSDPTGTTMASSVRVKLSSWLSVQAWHPPPPPWLVEELVDEPGKGNIWKHQITSIYINSKLVVYTFAGSESTYPASDTYHEAASVVYQLHCRCHFAACSKVGNQVAFCPGCSNAVTRS